MPFEMWYEIVAHRIESDEARLDKAIKQGKLAGATLLEQRIDAARELLLHPVESYNDFLGRSALVEIG